MMRQYSRFARSPTGELYVSYRFGLGGRVYRINGDGSLTPVVGGTGGGAPRGDGGPPLQAEFSALGGGLAFGSDGTRYIADYFAGMVCRVGPALPRYSGRSSFIPSEDGSVLYVFDAIGRHERTVHARTGATLLSFGYDSAGRLASVTDGNGDVTRVERDGSGCPAAIVTQDGRRTALMVNGDGFLAASPTLLARRAASPTPGPTAPAAG